MDAVVSVIIWDDHPIMTDRTQVCRRCENQPGGGRWALIDPSATAQITEDRIQMRRLQLVVIPPTVRAATVRAAVGLIQLRWGATIYGQVELSLCPIDRRGLLLGLHVEPRHRLRGVGSVLGSSRSAARRRTHARTKKTPDCKSNPVGRNGDSTPSIESS
jgi:hypothetical protein